MIIIEIVRCFSTILCTEIACILRNSKEGMPTILALVNENNEIIQDKLVPGIFESLYEVKKDIIKENVDVQLLKKPK